MRLVLDTNIALSGLLWGNKPGQLINAAVQQRVALASSTALLAELHGVLSWTKFAARFARRGFTATDIFDCYAALVITVSPHTVPQVVPNDPDDDHVIACAVAARADASSPATATGFVSPSTRASPSSPPATRSSASCDYSVVPPFSIIY